MTNDDLVAVFHNSNRIAIVLVSKWQEKRHPRSTKYIRVPIEKQELASYAIAQIKVSALPPLPLKVVRAFMQVA